MEKTIDPNTDIPEQENQLSISISRDGLSFCVHGGSAIEYYDSRDFFPYKTPEELLDTLADELEKIPDSFRIDSVFVMYSNQLFTLVPDALFDENYLSDYLKFNIQILPSDFAAYDKVDGSAVNAVYIPYANINNYLLDKFGVFDYCHVSSILPYYCSEKREEGLYLYVRSGSFYACFIDADDRVQLCNSFDFKTPQDFIYYILFCYEQLGLSPEKTSLFLLGEIAEDSDYFEICYAFIRHIKILKADVNTLTKTAEVDIPLNTIDPVFLKAFLCE